MKRILITMFIVILGLGCAKVQVQAPKEPIKVDISMRLDIYQHVVKDIDAIEDLVSGSKDKAKPKEGSFLDMFLSTAYAQEGLSPEVEQAALKRRDRLEELNSWQAKGVIGENKSGLVEIRLPNKADSTGGGLVEAENRDRLIIYEVVARKNGTTVEEVQKLYAQRLQSDAPSGTPIEVLNVSTGTYSWEIKP